MLRQRGFTIVEIIVVVTVLAILVGISFFAYDRVQQDSRDNTRRSNATAIAHALEKYYDQNGEYPSVRSIVNNYADNTGTVVAAKLKVPIETLQMPQMPSSATNGIRSAASPVNNYLIYTASSATDNSACQNNTTGGCDQFTLTFAQETGPNVTISSQNKP